MANAGPAQVRFGRGLCGDLAAAEAREWLLANGRGGYAMGTVAGTLTRRYHGLLIAATDPPVTRRLVVARLDLDVDYDGHTYALATNRWRSGAISPEGWRLAEAFTVEDGLPAWTYALGDALLDVTLAMPLGADATAVLLRVVRARGPLEVRGRVIVADRDHHGGPLPEPSTFTGTADASGYAIALPACGRTLRVTAPDAVRIGGACERYAGYLLSRETERGLPDTDDYVHACTVTWRLANGDEQGLVVSVDPPQSSGVTDLGAHGDSAALGRRDPREIVRVRRAANRARAEAQPTALLARLALAADAFVVERREPNAAPVKPPDSMQTTLLSAKQAASPNVVRTEPPNVGTTILAGYPWFTDWGRDTMIALPGLLLGTGRASDAAGVLRTFAAHVADGLVPNRFPDAGGPAEYNTIDASLWFVEAVRAYVAATDDATLLRDVFPAVEAVIEGYRRGTRYGIGVDADGLVRGGADGVQLTWMDAKVGDHVITPRRGKPVEVNALWYNALRACEQLAARLGHSPDGYRDDADRTAVAMQRFWSAERGWCYDVLDGPDGDDPTFRPNQLFTVSLFASAFDATRARAIVDACTARLWTSMGLRTLAQDDPSYHGTITGPQESRDAAYHQGTAWPWLLGPFVRAHLRAYGDRELTRTFVRPLIDALDAGAIGTLPEIADGDPPHAPRGCPAQAWSVGELIAVLKLLDAA